MSGSDPKAAAAEAVRALLASLASTPDPLRVVEQVDGRAALLLVWDAADPMPTVLRDRRRRERRCRERCRADVLAVVGGHGRPLTRRQVVTEMRRAGHAYGRHTIWKALGDLTAGGELVNPRDHRGYRLPGWIRPRLGLFDAW